ncbi:methyl-accepting chemotaxis protein [Duganella sp. SG902]|uniref:methyl-accepting chemotaxis protein n=1 Tax=Duganella sp. SG902 TaxID=2587016 RepID=UPI00159E1945|nr:methyl-accepting chemotaxis protein [Duganella sp. SG902]NVM78017.1 methyl-accepting chemotaxis protein [Duganella sp. SG902]
MKNIKIGGRLGLGFAVVLTLMLALALVGLSSMAKVEDQFEEIVNANMVKIALLTDMGDAIQTNSVAVRNVILFSDDVQRAPEVKRIAEQRARYEKSYQQLTGLVTRAKGKELLANIEARRAEAAVLMDKAIALAQADSDAEATSVLMGQVRPAQDQWYAALDALTQFQNENTAKSVAEARAIYQRTRLQMGLFTLAAVVLGALIAWLITRSIVRPVGAAVKVAQTVAAGDLTSNIEVTSRDETGQLLQALKDMNTGLVVMVGEVRGGTDMIASASQQIAFGAADLSSRTEEQASSLEETASSMEQLTATVRQNADNARQANQLALAAAEVAVKGGAVVSQVVGTMGSINDSARQIADIIGVIDGIAFQTNILALNAAVEAARAGEQGRGFAVVASEVRTLAQRSAAAAKEIKVLIDNSVQKVDAGSQLVEQAGSTMREVVDSIRQVTDMMQDITNASREQSAGIEQINQAVTEMDQVTQQNAALVEESAAASEAMKQQATRLSQMVSVFKLGGMPAGLSYPKAVALL